MIFELIKNTGFLIPHLRNHHIILAKKVKNIELWTKLNNLSNFHEIEWKWVKAHSGDPLNDMVDKLAKKAALII